MDVVKELINRIGLNLELLRERREREQTRWGLNVGDIFGGGANGQVFVCPMQSSISSLLFTTILLVLSMLS